MEIKITCVDADDMPTNIQELQEKCAAEHLTRLKAEARVEKLEVENKKNMAIVETCACCDKKGVVGRDVVPYFFTSKYTQWLCSIHTNPECSKTRYRAFREWMKKQKNKKT